MATTESERVDRIAGALAVLGGLCLFVGGVPARLYVGTSGDSYVFDPPLFSGLWVQRTIVPLLILVAFLGLFAGVVGLLRRDREEGRWHDVAGGLTAVGTGALLAAVVLLVATGSLSGGAPDVVGSVLVLVAALGGLLAGLLVTVASILWGVRYLRRGRRRLAATLIAVPVATVLFVALAVAVELPTGGGMLVLLPTVVGSMVLGVDLWTGSVADGSTASVSSESVPDEASVSNESAPDAEAALGESGADVASASGESEEDAESVSGENVSAPSESENGRSEDQGA